MDARLAGGGILVDHGWHNLYLLKRVLFPAGEAPLPLEAAVSLHRPVATAAETEATVFFRFPSATALLHLTWRAAARRNWAVFHGSRASLELRDDHLILQGAGPEQRFTFAEKLSAGSAHPEWFAAMLPQFQAEIQDPAARGRNLEEAAFVLSLIRRSYDGALPPRSYRHGAAAPALRP